MDLDDRSLKIKEKEEKSTKKTPINKIEPSTEGHYKVYVSSESEVPTGRTAHRGSGGGLYYFTATITGKQDKGEFEGAQRTVRVVGDGVGLVAGIVDGKLVARSLKNKETSAFIRKVMECAGGADKPGQVLSCMKKIGNDLGLEVSS